MPPKLDKQPVDVVELDSSSDEECDNVVITATATTATKRTSPSPTAAQLLRRSSRAMAATAAVEPPAQPRNSEASECRSFWKAGDHATATSARAPPAHDQLEYARVHPKFLHSNATSHKWAFGAIAELLDNAVDEIHNGATFVKVDKIDIMKDHSPALIFQDNGGGMNPDAIRKCMSLGYSSKKSNTTIGQCNWTITFNELIIDGNGFKTSTMRLGADVIVFSRASHAGKSTQSVGLLSYTFLQKTGQDDVIVPMIDFDVSGHWAEPIINSSQDDWSSNLKTILEWSPFKSKDVLLQQFEDIGSHGTKIIIYNLWLNDEGIYELSFDDDDEDIRLRDEASHGGQKLHPKAIELKSHISYRIQYSLRAYASILYLRRFTNFKILLRGKPVKQFNIADELKYPKKVTYKPQVAMTSKEATVEITIGFIKEAPNLSVRGFNVYHKSRLIRPFWRVTGDAMGTGKGVVGVLEANFIEPAHDKQDFERSHLFIRLEAKLKQMHLEYWRTHCHLLGLQPPGFSMKKGNNANTEKQMPKHGIHEKVILDGDPAGVPLQSPQHVSNRQLGNSGQIAMPIEQCVTRGADRSPSLMGSHNDVVSVDGMGSESVDQIRKENILLFMKCEEHRQKETELKQTVEELEKELEQAKRKCAQLAAHLETKKKQRTMTQQKVS